MEPTQTLLKDYSSIDAQTLSNRLDEILESALIKNNNTTVLEKLFNCIDLTSLNTTDSEDSIAQWVEKVNQFEDRYPTLPQVAALCVYPAFVGIVKDILIENVEIAAVTAGFPHAQTFIEVKIAETSLAVLDGASEIDVVLSVGKLKDKKYEELIEELVELKAACRGSKLKVILETGVLSFEEIRIASILALESGADFIKTSTGKLQPAATKEAAYIMCQVIKEFNDKRNAVAGFKAAGGISTTQEALIYYSIVEAILGEEAITPERFRIGASRLANQLIADLTGEEVNYY